MYLALEAGDAATWGGTFVAIAVAVGSWVQGYQDRKKQERERSTERQRIERERREERERQERLAEISAQAAEASHRQAEAAERRAFAVEQMLQALLSNSVSNSWFRLDRHSEEGGGSSGPRERVEWVLERRGKHLFDLRNTGNVAATGVRVDPSNMPPIFRNLPEDAVARPQEAVEFMMVSTMGGLIPSEIWVTWEGQDEPVAVPVPA